jgi:putative transposon-encoded protein
MALEGPNRIILEDIHGFLIQKVTNFDNCAQVDYPKQYLGCVV